VVCIAFYDDRVISWVIPWRIPELSPGGGPVRPYIVWGTGLHGSPSWIHALESYPEWFSGSSILYPTSLTTVGAVLLATNSYTDVERGLCPIPYPRKSMPRAQSRVPGSDKPSSSS
jgi:hypothetical protein